MCTGFNRNINLALFILLAMILGCSSGGSHEPPVLPDNLVITAVSEQSQPSGNSHALLLYNLIYLDPDHPDGPKVEVIPVREAEIHLNILKLLEDGPCFDCFKIVGFNFPQPGILDVDIQIDHPFDILDFSVFDVRGIMMFRGSHEFPVAGKSISDKELGDGALLNADGYTALYNGNTIDAPVGPLQKYYEGNFATPEIPNADINGYKYYTTDNPSNDRNAFFADSSGVDVQTYSIKLPTGPFVLGYAVDANWWLPIESPVDDPLTDFDLNANCPEAWKIEVSDLGPGLSTTEGATTLQIDVFDWQGKDSTHPVMVECPAYFDGEATATWISDGDGYTRYEVTLNNTKHPAVGKYPCLINQEASENDPSGSPWMDLTCYKVLMIENGNLLWAKRAGSPTDNYDDSGNGITTLSDNSVVVIGAFGETATFGKDEPNEVTLTSQGFEDLFIACYDNDGLLQWVKHAGSPSMESISGIDSFTDDSFVVTGKTASSITFGLDEPNETILESAGDADIFVARFNSDGALAWARSAGGPGHDWGSRLATLTDGSVVVIGIFGYLSEFSTATFGQGEPNETVLQSDGEAEIFIARYNPDGTLGWAKSAGGPDADFGNDITVLSDNSFIIIGSFEGIATFGQGETNETTLNSYGEYDIFIARYNPDGTLAWAKCAGGSNYDVGYGITTLTDDSVVITGEFTFQATFGTGEINQTVLHSFGYQDLFIARYNPDGTLQWAKNAGGDHSEAGYGIATLNDDSTVITGGYSRNYKSSAIFGYGEPNETVLETAGGQDIFIARYYPDGTLTWAKSAGGTGFDQGNGISRLSDNSIAVTGLCMEAVTFGEGEPNETVLEPYGGYDIFIARFMP